MFPSRRIITSGGDKFRDEYSLTFDGSSDFIAIGDTHQTMLRGDFSVSAWVKLDDGIPGTLAAICGSKNSSAEDWWYCGIASAGGSEGKMITYYKANNDADVGYSDAAVFPNGQTGWGHLVYSVSKSTATNGFKFFFNGKLVGVDASDAVTTGNWEAFTTDITPYIGGYNNNHTVSNALAGAISDVAFYDKALTSSEAATIYNSREPYNHKEGICSGNLNSWYRMGDGKLDSTRHFTSPVVEGGVISDESQSSYLGPDLVDDAMNASNWTVWGNNTVELDSGAIKITYVDNASGAYFYLRNTDGMTEDITIGKVYKVSYQAKVNTGSIFTSISESGGLSVTGNTTTSTSYINYAIYIVGTATGDHYFYGGGMGAGEIVYYTNIKVQEVVGNTGVIQNMASNQFSGDTP